ncbi:Oidioi.mRNA.OKI2018_I69.chr1.g2869.t1.cds [Oikopleura dioica]|uniref:Oidioi.mRNA.OKI2018_I69.chr1.g2869.t1.cds n=1 Tax=Oikopleura dioica TaxID=34765 RepID=A0ABN7SYU5_OIKDI|nr:Oidioi.mRNA.OKI2018_I69.chr1.g2869.t1.cds [Oikopleura dioica]
MSIDIQKLGEEKLKHYQETFKKYDKNEDGTVTTAELATVLKESKKDLSNQQIEDAVQKYDADGNGIIDFFEFIKLMANFNRDEEGEEAIRAVFRVFDKDGNGFISTKELREILKELGDDVSDKEIIEMIRNVDIDGDGKVNYDEFVQMLA